MRGKIMQIIRACKLSEPLLHYVFMGARELCPERVCKLSGVCELVRVKLSGLYCVGLAHDWRLKSAHEIFCLQFCVFPFLSIHQTTFSELVFLLGTWTWLLHWNTWFYTGFLALGRCPFHGWCRIPWGHFKCRWGFPPPEPHQEVYCNSLVRWPWNNGRIFLNDSWAPCSPFSVCLKN